MGVGLAYPKLEGSPYRGSKGGGACAEGDKHAGNILVPQQLCPHQGLGFRVEGGYSDLPLCHTITPAMFFKAPHHYAVL